MSSTSENSTRVVIVDDETLFARALGMWLANDRDLKIEGYARSGNQGWEVCSRNHPDVALVDFEMEDGDGLSLARRLLDELPDTRVIMMTGRVDPHTAWKAGQIGVHGLVDKTIEPELLCQVIHLVRQGGGFVSPAFQQIRKEWLNQPEAFQKVLTNRELMVLHLVTEGRTDPDIGEQLGISPETVACHRKSMRKKLDVHDDRSLVAYGREWGIFKPGG